MGHTKDINEPATSAGSDNSHKNLLEASILPVWLNQRTIGFFGFIWLWIGMAVIIATFQLGAGGVAGLPLVQVVAIIFFANLVLGIVMSLTADIGTEHGLSFAVYLRAPFGSRARIYLRSPEAWSLPFGSVYKLTSAPWPLTALWSTCGGLIIGYCGTCFSP